jgi:pilus assembly protein CpaD
MKLFTRSVQGFAVCTALLLSACESDVPAVRGAEDALSPTQRFPITVEAQMASYPLALNNARNDLAPAGESTLEQIVTDYLANGSGSIAVSAGNATPRISDRLAALGVPSNRIMIVSGTAGGNATVSFIRYHADPQPCGDWSTNLGVTYNNQAPPNFGCATQHNLAIMVADPHDLVTPKTLEPGDAQRSLTVLDKYRQGETTVTSKVQDQSGAVSSVATGGK